MGPLIAGASLAAALELVGHYFPWPKRLHRIAAYVWGTGAILAGVAVATERKTLLRTFVVCGAAGVATIAAYIVDIHLHARQKRRMYGRNGRG